MLKTRRKITLARSSPQHEPPVLRHDANPCYRQIPGVLFHRPETPPNGRANGEQELVVVATGKRGTDRFVPERPVIFANTVRERNRLFIDDDSDARCRGDLPEAVGK